VKTQSVTTRVVEVPNGLMDEFTEWAKAHGVKVS
jgi:hypothetical protein